MVPADIQVAAGVAAGSTRTPPGVGEQERPLQGAPGGGRLLPEQGVHGAVPRYTHTQVLGGVEPGAVLTVT